MAKPLTASQKAAVAAEKARQAAAAAKKNKPKPAPSKAAKPKPASKPAARPALPPGRQGGPLATRPGTRPALPPGRQGGAVVRQGNAKPENPRRTNARNRQATAGRGTTGPGRVGQPAGSANRMFGANRVNQAVNRAVTQSNLRTAFRGGTGASVVGALLNAPEELKKLQALLRNPKGALSRASSDILSGKPYDPKTVTKASKPKPKPNMNRPGIRYEKLADTQAPRSAYGLKDKPPTKPPAKAPSAGTRTPSRPTASAPSRAPSRSSTPARPAASRPAATPAKATPKPSLRSDTVQGTGPIKDGGTYARNVKKQPTSGNSFAGSKDMSASEMAASYNTKTNYGSRVDTAFSAESPSTKPSTPKKKSSALSQAEIRKRRLNR